MSSQLVFILSLLYQLGKWYTHFMPVLIQSCYSLKPTMPQLTICMTTFTYFCDFLTFLKFHQLNLQFFSFLQQWERLLRQNYLVQLHKAKRIVHLKHTPAPHKHFMQHSNWQTLKMKVPLYFFAYANIHDKLAIILGRMATQLRLYSCAWLQKPQNSLPAI